MKLEVPYYSQHKDVKDEKWKKHSCAIVCVYMVLDYMRKRAGLSEPLLSIDNLIYEGFELRGTGTYGWTHDSLVWLLHNHGVKAYREEFKSIDGDLLKKFAEAGLEKIKKSLSDGNPVIVSGIKKWTEDKKFHTFVLVGFEEDISGLSGFYYNDPDDDPKTTSKSDVRAGSQETGKELFVDVETFKKKWRKLAIFVY